jgi:uncharacterized SAM-dependent methyltransferase
MTDGPLLPFDAGKPSVARLHDYALGGKDNFTADRAMAAELVEIYPPAAMLARDSREFQARAVAYVARQGVVQFIDVGCGMPASPATHEVATAASPDARVAYVDNDPVVISHAAALMARPGQVTAVPGDVCRPHDILAHRELTSLIDLSEPFCLILGVILDFVRPAEAERVMAVLRDAMPPGSFVILCIGISNGAARIARDWDKAYGCVARMYLHNREQIKGYFTGLEIVEPGLTEARSWRPAQPPAITDPLPIDALAYVGRKPR